MWLIQIILHMCYLPSLIHRQQWNIHCPMSSFFIFANGQWPWPITHWCSCNPLTSGWNKECHIVILPHLFIAYLQFFFQIWVGMSLWLCMRFEEQSPSLVRWKKTTKPVPRTTLLHLGGSSPGEKLEVWSSWPIHWPASICWHLWLWAWWLHPLSIKHFSSQKVTRAKLSSRIHRVRKQEWNGEWEVKVQKQSWTTRPSTSTFERSKFLPYRPVSVFGPKFLQKHLPSSHVPWASGLQQSLFAWSGFTCVRTCCATSLHWNGDCSADSAAPHGLYVICKIPSFPQRLCLV